MKPTALIITLAALLCACSDRQVKNDAGASDGPARDQQAPPDKKAPDKKAPDKKIGWDAKLPDTKLPPDTFLQQDGKLTCPPMPNCNWCGGTLVKDKNGCGVGYKCKNGVDPCKVPPCSASSCKASEYCGKDALCWPKKDSGPPTPDTGSVSCKNGVCSGSSAGDCGCEWTCTNGNKYKVDCKQTTPSSKDCTCKINGAQVKTCVYPGSAMSCSPASLASCCGFPN